ncbi:hypothetical protein ES705_36685 [subsurface metagenome]
MVIKYVRYPERERQSERELFHMDGYADGVKIVGADIEAGSEEEAISRMKYRYEDVTAIFIRNVRVWGRLL